MIKSDLLHSLFPHYFSPKTPAPTPEQKRLQFRETKIAELEEKIFYLKQQIIEDNAELLRLNHILDSIENPNSTF